MAPKELHRNDNSYARHGLDLLEKAQWQGIHHAQAAVHEQQISSCLADDLLHARFHSLQHAEQRKGDADLKKRSGWYALAYARCRTIRAAEISCWLDRTPVVLASTNRVDFDSYSVSAARRTAQHAALDAPLPIVEPQGGGWIMEYKARCHCGRVRFSFRSPEIKSGKRCNCSLCIRRGTVLSWTYIPAADFTPHQDLRDMGVYLWNEKVLSNYFCRACGVFTYIGDGERAKDGYRVNLGCVEGLDPLALEIAIIDGQALPVIEDPCG